MDVIQELKAVWKKFGLKGHVRNFSSKPIWVLESSEVKSIAHLLLPMTKSPVNIDVDAFRRKDDQPIEGHNSWWKFYSGTTAEVFDAGKDLRVSVIAKTAVNDREFTRESIEYDSSTNWGVPVKLVTDVRRDKKKNISGFYVTGTGWLDIKTTLAMTCHGEIDNARPVFPSIGGAYIRTRRDKELFNNLTSKG